MNIARSQPVQEQARVQEIPEIQVTERVQDLIFPERIEEVRQKLFVAEETTQSVAEFSDSASGRVCHTQRRPRPTLPPARAVLDEWIAHMPL